MSGLTFKVLVIFYRVSKQGGVDLNMLSLLHQIVVRIAYRSVCNVVFLKSIDVYRLDRQF
jgi:hypothetical protein